MRLCDPGLLGLTDYPWRLPEVHAQNRRETEVIHAESPPPDTLNRHPLESGAVR
jgi:hypothetical protein